MSIQHTHTGKLAKSDTNRQRLRGRELEKLTLHALGNFGWLVTSQLARWTQDDSKSAFVMQQRVVKRMHERGLIERRKDRLGRWCFYLSKPGAALLRELEPGASWHHGHDLSIENLAVQAAAFEQALIKKCSGYLVLGKPGIRAYGIKSNANLWVCGETGNEAVIVRNFRYSCYTTYQYS